MLETNPKNIGGSQQILKYANTLERYPGKRSLVSIQWLFLFWSSLHLTLITDLSSGHQQSSSPSFKCSYVPPTPDQVTHVWLDSMISKSSGKSFELDDSITPARDASLQGMSSSRVLKRHVANRRDHASNFQNPLWNILSRLGLRENDSFVPIKIHVHYDSSVYSLERPKFDLITKTVMPSVINFFESVLSMRREYIIERFRMSRRCPNNITYHKEDRNGVSRTYCMDRCENYAICGELTVPREHLSACSFCNSTTSRCVTDFASEGEGVHNAQMVLYVSAKQTSRCNKDQTIAYAAHCAQDAKTDRPVAGHANLCPSSISTDVRDLRALVATVKHELTHVLGFSVSLFAYYRDKNGSALTERGNNPGPIPPDPKTGYAQWSDKVIKKVIRTNWVNGEGTVNKEAHLIVTPTVVREARNHFNCSSLEGAELEDQGSDGTSMTHWEKRLFENEAMTGTHTQNSVYSRLTLAVLQDTGWYVANFSRAERLEWGKDLGCDFAKKSCKSWIDERRAQGKSISPFCDRVKTDTLRIYCTEDRVSKAVCNMKSYKEPLPEAYRNFDYLEGVRNESLAYFGGSVDLADYCPFIQEFSWLSHNVTVRGSRCDISGSSLESDRNAALEFYGPQTKCFEHSGKFEQRSCVYKRHWYHYGAGCYKYTCSDGHVSIIVGNHSYACYYPDQRLYIEQLNDLWLYNGTIICPPCEKVCQAHKCKSFDKRMVDRILSIRDEQTKAGMNKNSMSEEDSNQIYNEILNSIDFELTDILDDKFNALGSYSNSSLNLARLKDWKGIKESLVHIVSRSQLPPKALLVCSGANKANVLHIVLSIVVIFTASSVRFVMMSSI